MEDFIFSFYNSKSVSNEGLREPKIGRETRYMCLLHVSTLYLFHGIFACV